MKGGAKKGSKQRRNEEAISILATNIKKFRIERGYTIHELANKLELDYSQISRMERCVVNPTVSIIFDIAKLLNIHPNQLLS
jgi:transcriptional regulator with XRE-family HTH domain